MLLTVIPDCGRCAGFSRVPSTAPGANAVAEQHPMPALQAIGAVQPRISPDGRAIVFSYQGAIWRLPIEGGIMKRLAAPPGFASEPCWSPDGSRVAFVQGRNFAGGQVQVVDSSTGATVALPQRVFGNGKLEFSPTASDCWATCASNGNPKHFAPLT